MGGVWTSVLVTLIIQALVSLVIFAPPVLAPVAQNEIGLPASAVGVSTALIYSSAAFAALGSSVLIPRYGPLRTSQISLLLGAGGMALMAIANPWVVALGALVIGFGYGMVTPSSSAILAERAPPGLRALIFSVKQTGVPIGGAIAGAAIPVLAHLYGWKGAAIACSLACILCSVFVQPFRSAWDRSRRKTVSASLRLVEPLRLVWRDRQLRELALASFSYSGMQMTLGSFLVVFFNERGGLSLHAAGAALSTAMMAGVIGRILWGVVSDRGVPPRKLLAILGVAMSGAAFATAVVESYWPFFLVLLVSFCFGLTAVGWNGVYLSEVAHLARKSDPAAATGASLFVTYIGVVTLPAVFFLVVALTNSYAAAFCVSGLITLWRSSLLFSNA